VRKFNRARSQRSATANGVTFWKSNSLTARFTAISMSHFRCIATWCRRNQKHAFTIPISENTIGRLWFGSVKPTNRQENHLPPRGALAQRRRSRLREKTFVVKKRQRFRLDELRQRFRLTQTERRVAMFIAAAFMLGLITKCYRDGHPSPTPPQAHSKTTMTSRSKKAYGDRTKRARKFEEKLNLPDSAEERYH